MSSEDTQLPLASPDPVADLLAQLRAAAPQVFSEGRVDFDKLKAALGEQIDQNPERYGLSWAGKSDAFRNVRAPSIGTLLPMPEDSVNWDSTENLIIEGDNLEVLKLLQKSYHSQIKMIYIDPPYNTGNDFIYRDNYRQSLDDYLRFSGQVDAEGAAQSTNRDSSGRYHSDWLSMMYPRLFLARNLLREDGVIFVSIDDNEVHNLRMLMNEVFGEENILQQIIWKRHAGGGNDSRHFAVDHEYILAYARNKSAISRLRLPLSDEDRAEYSLQDEHYERLGPYKTKSFRRMRPDDPRPTMTYDIETPDGEIVRDTWKWEEPRYLSAKTENKVITRKDKNNKWQIEYKIYLYSPANDDDEESEERTKVPRSLLTDIEKNSAGKRQLRDAMGAENVFSNPKPVGLIKYLLSFSTEKDSLTLDFFAGSGTTAQAVLEQNQEDGGNRRFILSQIPQKTEGGEFPTIAHITRERVRRVIARLDQEDGGKKSTRGFRAFKLSSSNFRIWNAERTPDDPAKLAEQLQLYADNSGQARDEQDILYELILKSGLPLSASVTGIKVAGTSAWSVDDNKLLILLNKSVSREVLRAMIALQPQQLLCLDAAFNGDDALKTSIVLEARSHGITFRTI